MTTGRCCAAHQLGLIPAGATVLGDPSFDTNPLHETAAECGAQLLAPRRKPQRSISTSHRQHPGRLASIATFEHDPETAARLKAERGEIKRCFGAMATVGGGLSTLPAWARRLHRARNRVGAKLVLNAAREVLIVPVAA